MYIAKLPVFQSLYVLNEGEVSEMWLAKTRSIAAKSELHIQFL